LTAPLDLAALRSLVERATPGPWEIDDERSRYGEKYPNGDPIDDNDIHGIHGPGGVAIVKTDCGVYPPDRPDAEFIAASRTAVPALLDMVEALKAEAERLREERDVLASEHAECPDRQKAALALLSERAQLQEAFERATKKAAEGKRLTTPRLPAEWHEDHGTVLWWRFPVVEPPWVGSPLDDEWEEEADFTHWTPLPNVGAALGEGER
jgi:hypothetical protein